MVPVSIVSTNAGAAGRSRNFGTNRAPSRAFSPASGGPGYVNGTVSPITFDGGSGRRSMKQGGPPLSAVREFGYPEMEPDEGKHDSPLEIRVQVQEEVKSDYDSAYAGPDVRGNVSVACYQTKTRLSRPTCNRTLTESGLMSSRLSLLLQNYPSCVPLFPLIHTPRIPSLVYCTFPDLRTLVPLYVATGLVAVAYCIPYVEESRSVKRRPLIITAVCSSISRSLHSTLDHNTQGTTTRTLKP